MSIRKSKAYLWINNNLLQNKNRVFVKKLFLIIYVLAIFNQQLNAQNSLAWAKKISGQSIGYTIHTDNFNNLIYAGVFSGTNDFDFGPGTATLAPTNTTDAFISKTDANGNFLWVKQSTSLTIRDIKTDNAGNIYVTGSFLFSASYDGNFILGSGNHDGFILKLDPNGNLIWGQAIGGTNPDIAYALDLDQFNNIIIGGFFQLTVDFDPGPSVYNLTAGSNPEGFILKLDNAGSFIWARHISGNVSSNWALNIDPFGNIWTCGYFNNVVDFDPGVGTYTLSTNSNGSNCDVNSFVLKLDASGNFLNANAFYSTPIAFSGQSYLLNLEFDASGNAYCAGYYSGSIKWGTGPTSFSLSSVSGSNDGFVAKFDNSLNIAWLKSIGGAASDFIYDFKIDSNDQLQITGSYIGSCDFNPNAGVYNLNSVGNEDIFLFSLNENGDFLCASSMGGVTNDEGFGIVLDANDNIYTTGYFTNTTDFDPGPGFNFLACGSPNECFITKFNQKIISAPISTSLCTGSSITFSSNPSLSYVWTPTLGLNSSTSAVVIASPSINTTYTANGFGCLSTSTVVTIAAFAKPQFTLPVTPQNITCTTPSINLSSIPNGTNVALKWRQSINFNYANQPYPAVFGGTYYCQAKDVNSGCMDSSAVVLLDKKINPNSKLISHNYISPFSPIDTVTCIKSVSVTAGSDTANVTVYLKAISNNSVYTNPNVFTSQNNFKVVVVRNDNGCADSSKIVLINENKFYPSIQTNTSNPAVLNCNYQTFTLSSNFSPSNCIAVWTNSNNTTFANPVQISIPGKYVLNVTNPENGCVKKDSLTIAQTNGLIVNLGPNKKVCKNGSTLLTANSPNINNVSFVWNNLITSNTISLVPSNSQIYTVVATNTAGCYGTNTIAVIVPPDITDSTQVYRNCSQTNAGSIVFYNKGGIPPYAYSVNNGLTFTSTALFSSLAYGNYSLTVKDSLGCTLSRTIEVNALGELPTPKFLASTKNFTKDTIVFIDISAVKADSVQWLLPATAYIINNDFFNPIVVFSDTGSFSITMRSFYGNCLTSYTKLMRFGKQDSLLANYYNANGISSYTLFPNPNSGNFNVVVNFYKKQNATIQIWRVNGVKYFQQNFYEVNAVNLPISLPELPNGSYFARIIGEYDAKQQQFIISK